MKTKTHITVLKDESLEALKISQGDTIIDATFGSGGHAHEILKTLKGDGTFVGIDADPDAIHAGKAIVSQSPCTTHLCVGNYKNIDVILEGLGIHAANGILADLGWRMEQFGGNGRGFSFMYDEDLFMTFGDPKEYSFVARDILNEWEERDIRNVLKGYGEERYAGRIAHAIVMARAIEPIMTTYALVNIIKGAVPAVYAKGKLHPATRTFQALRIAVNDEFETLETFIRKAVSLLKPHGRLAIITFHSIEDRIVKHMFRQYVHDHIGTVITKKPIIATKRELAENPRARSAKLRIFEKHGEV